MAQGSLYELQRIINNQNSSLQKLSQFEIFKQASGKRKVIGGSSGTMGAQVSETPSFSGPQLLSISGDTIVTINGDILIPI